MANILLSADDSGDVLKSHCQPKPFRHCIYESEPLIDFGRYAVIKPRTPLNYAKIILAIFVYF